jgi:hypothetical protein
MRARLTPPFTPRDQASDVEIREFADGCMRFEGGRLADPDKVAATLARLIDVLASRDGLTGGEVLQVLGFASGQLELDDGTPRSDAEWRDYWAARDAAVAAEHYATPTAAGFYWAKNPGGDWQVVEVTRCGPAVEDLHAWHSGCEQSSDLSGLQWGPRIEPPKAEP